MPSVTQDNFIRRSFLVIMFGLGGFISWSCFVPLSEGVGADGTVVVESERQIVQHLEGGIVHEIKVTEGSEVTAGQPVIVLHDAGSIASRDDLISEVVFYEATLARLLALMNNDTQPEFPKLADYDIDAENFSKTILQQQRAFEDQRYALKSEVGVLRSKKVSATDAVRLKRLERASAEKGLNSLEAELTLARTLLSQQMGRINQVHALERDHASMKASIARLDSEIGQASSLYKEYDSEIRKINSSFMQKLAAEMLQVQSDLSTTQKRLIAAQDILARSIIYAPRSGKVLNMKFNTVGGVVRPGETIMEIVPVDEQLLASVKVQPSSRAQVYEGLEVRATLTAYRGWRAKPFRGEVIGISADLKEDPSTGAQYFEARVRLDAQPQAAKGEVETTPGMPVQVFIYSGQKRTAMESFLEPLKNSLFLGLRTT